MIKNVFGRDATKVTLVTSTAISPLDKKLAELRQYNKEHNTHLSYGKYEAKRYWERCNPRKK